jgi:hypothetical protein
VNYGTVRNIKLHGKKKSDFLDSYTIGIRVAEPENLKTVPVPTFYLITVPVPAPVPSPVPGHIHTYTFTNAYT